MSRVTFRGIFDALPGELVVDNFAGGGGASSGIEAAIGRPCDIAINHDPVAIRMHAANHPGTKHFVEDVWQVDPRDACGGRPVGLAWFSPDCTHFSRAKGQTPVKKEIRALAWVVIRWAKTVKPRIIILENVQEFEDWGPVIETQDGLRPDPGRKGLTFRNWLGKLRAQGYSIEFRTLNAADYGTPTTRRRLFLIARRDRDGICFPKPTHGAGRQPWKPAYEIIDWSIPCPSIFERKRPLAEATLRRIAKGIERYVIDSPDPFLVPAGQDQAVSPFIVRHGHYSTKTGAGLREGCGAGTFRGQPLQLPLGTVCATNDKNLVVPLVTKHYGGMVGHDIRRTLGTVTARDHHALTAAFLTKFNQNSKGQSLREPLHTVTAGGGRFAQVRAFLIAYYSSGGQTASLFDPMRTVTSRARFGLVTVQGQTYRIVDIGMRMLQPHELFAAQGFPETYEIQEDAEGRRFTKTEQIRLCGNSVCPPMARAMAEEQVAA